MEGLRSSEWYGSDGPQRLPPPGVDASWGALGDALSGKRPQIAIANTASDLTPCNLHLDEVAESVKHGVYEAGGIPLNLPVVSLGETLVRPTAMLWRNMAAMAMEEMFRANPIDGLVLLGGCDKTIPALLMAAASVGIPAVVVPGGPMLNGTFRGRPLGCGTDVWRLSEEVRAGNLSQESFLRSESSMIRSKGHCNTMGTASTMAVMAEALGTTLPGLAGTPAADARLLEGAHESGRLAVELVQEGRTIGDVVTAGSFTNAIVALAAVGGSTNAVVHLLAIAGRLGIELSLDDFDRVGAARAAARQPPARRPSSSWRTCFGPGGCSPSSARCATCSIPRPSPSPAGPSSTTSRDAPVWDETVITPRDRPLLSRCRDRGPAWQLRAATAPSSSRPRRHRTCCATADPPSSSTRSRTSTPGSTPPSSTSTAASVLVLRGCGPMGYPGMPEVANLPLPAAAAAGGGPRHGADLRRPDERDGIRHGRAPRRARGRRGWAPRPSSRTATSSSSTSRTADLAPRRPRGGDRPAQTPCDARRRGSSPPRRGWERLYVDHVQQADTGADLDFLVGATGPGVARESH